MNYFLSTDIKKKFIKISDNLIVTDITNNEVILNSSFCEYRLKGPNLVKYFLPIIYNLSCYNSIESLYKKIEKNAIKDGIEVKLEDFIKLIENLYERNIIIFYDKTLNEELKQKSIAILNFGRVENVVSIKELFEKSYGNRCSIFQFVQDYDSEIEEVTNVFFNKSITFNLKQVFNKMKFDLVIATFSSYNNGRLLKKINNFLIKKRIPWIPYISNNDKISVGPIFDDFSDKKSTFIINEICNETKFCHYVVENSISLDAFYFMACSMLVNECYLILNQNDAMIKNKIIEFKKNRKMFYYKDLTKCFSGKESIFINSIINDYKSIEGTSLHDLYHLNSELDDFSYDFSKQIYNAMNKPNFINEINKKKYINEKREQIRLIRVESEELPKKTVFDTLLYRRSIRNFSNSKISFFQLSALLQYSLLNNDTLNYSIDNKLIRNKSSMLFPYPLAGGIRCLNVYIVIKNVENIPVALYKYNDEDHTLIYVKDFNNTSISEFTLCESLRENCSFIVYVTGDLEKLEYKYGNRAYRFMNLSAGHLAQNIYLAGTSLGLGVVASGGFKDVNIINYINEEECKYILYEIFVGNVNVNVNDPRL